MTFAILGASGHTGQTAVRYCLRRGHKARVLVRSPQKMSGFVETREENFEAVQGDVTDPKSVKDVIKGTDAVISALGPSDFETGFKVHSSAAVHLSRLMPEEGISRYISVSGASVSVPTDGFSIRGKFFSAAAYILTKTNGNLKKLLADKKREYEILKESPLDWTLVRPPWIVPGGYVCEANITPSTLQGIKVRVGELAKAVVDLAGGGGFNKQAVFINSRARPTAAQSRKGC